MAHVCFPVLHSLYRNSHRSTSFQKCIFFLKVENRRRIQWCRLTKIYQRRMYGRAFALVVVFDEKRRQDAFMLDSTTRFRGTKHLHCMPYAQKTSVMSILFQKYSFLHKLIPAILIRTCKKWCTPQASMISWSLYCWSWFTSRNEHPARGKDAKCFELLTRNRDIDLR